MEQRDNLLEILRILYRRRNIILRVCGVVFIGSIIISLLLPEYYKATTIFYAANQDLSNPDKMFGGGNSDTYYFGSGEDIDRIMTIASSNELVDRLIKEFSLYKHYRIDSSGQKSSHKIRKHFFELYKVEKTKYDAIELSIEDKDPKLAAEMTNAARKQAEEIARSMVRKSQLAQMETYEQSIKDGQKWLDLLGDSLMQLRQKYAIYNPGTQGQLIASSLAATQSQATMLSGKLESFKADPRTPRDTIIIIKANLEGTLRQLKRLEEDVKLYNEGSSLVSIVNDQLDKSRFQYGWDYERYKKLKAAYNAHPTILHLVEEAQEPVVKLRPVRSVIVLGSTLIAFILIVVGILFFENYKDIDWSFISRSQD
jgi:uncharacterized protein involved in exopolysaccharide biosynthesis